MRKALIIVASLLAAGLIAVAVMVWSAFGGAELDPPVEPPVPATSPPPDHDFDATFASHTVVTDFEVPLDRLETFLFEADDPNGFGPVVQAFEETDQIKKPVEAVYFGDDWPAVGAMRRVRLSDGHYALERVLINEPRERFAYQIWGYTTKTGKNVDYILGDQRFEARPDGGSRMTWSYHVRPNAGWKRPLIQGFVNSNVAPFLDGAMERVAAELETTQ